MGFDARDQMERFCRWRDEGYLGSNGRCFDVGVTIRAALRRFGETGDPMAGSTDPRTAGNGSIMRLAPVALFFDPDLEAVARFSAESSRTTRSASFLAQDGMFTSAEYQKLNQVDRDTAYKEIRQLVELGMVAGPEKRGRGARYRVITGATSTPTDRIRQRMREKGRITNRDWRDVFGANPAQASYALGKLCTQRVLARSGPHGRGVFYVPGPAWAGWRETSKNDE